MRCLMMLLAACASARPRDGAVTLSMTTTAGEDIGRAARSMVASLNSSLVRVRRAVVDADPARPADAAAVRAHGAALAALVADGALTEVARVDYGDAYTKGNASVFARLFGRTSGPARNRRVFPALENGAYSSGFSVNGSRKGSSIRPPGDR